MPTSQAKYRVNGFTDPEKSDWENIEAMAAACNAWVTFDSQTGKFSIVINQRESSVYTFNDDNIIGEITFSQNNYGTGYNQGEIKYANRDAIGQYDTLTVDFLDTPNIPFYYYDVFPEDPVNKLSMTSNFINNSAQASSVLGVNIAQSHRDFVATWTSDYTAIGLSAGDVVTVEATIFQTGDATDNTSKRFRIVNIEETDDDDGNILLKFTGVDYQDHTYESLGFTIPEIDLATGIPPIKTNTQAQQNIAEGNGARVGEALATDVGRNAITSAGIPLFASAVTGFSPSQMASTFGSGSGAGTPTSVIQSVNASIKTLIVNFNGPQATYNYTVDGSSKTISAGVPAQITLSYSPDDISYTTLETKYMEWSSYITSFTVNNGSAGYYALTVSSLNTYDLNATNNFVTINSGMTSGSFFLDSSGNAASVTWIAFLN